MPTAVAGYGFCLRLSVCVCLSVFMHDISKTDVARITKLDLEMFHDEYWTPINVGFGRSEVKVTSHKNIAGVGLCTLVSAGFFWCLYRVHGLDLISIAITLSFGYSLNFFELILLHAAN